MPTCVLTGLAVCTTPNALRRQAFATSTTVFSPSWSCSSEVFCQSFAWEDNLQSSECVLIVPVSDLGLCTPPPTKCCLRSVSNSVSRRVHPRVLYIDIDIHHGDGVEEAFYTTDRVMTASFHKFGDYFPGTGSKKDIGYGKGKRYSINCPLRDGMDDDSFREVFQPIIRAIMERFQPGAVVLQCGADSLAGDRLGCFNLSLRGHAGAVKFVRDFGLPTLVLGGGGYTMRNVARCWTYETSILTGIDIDDELPYNDYFEYYGPDYTLQIETSNMENLNSRKYLEDVTAELLECLRGIEAAPGLEAQTGSSLRTPKAFELAEEDDGDESEQTGRSETRRRQHKGEYYDSVRDQDRPDGGEAAAGSSSPSYSSSAAAAAAGAATGDA